MNYSFLNAIKIVDTGGLKAPKTKNPTGLTVRVFADGSIYPSQETVNTFDLQFRNKQEEFQGNAFDVVDTAEWKPMQAYPRMIMFGVTPKSASKVDLFGSTKYQEDGTPKADVMTQGAKDGNLLNLVKDLGWLNENQKYVDLKIVKEHPLNTENGIAYIPKTISRGKDAGQTTYTRRENTTFYPVELVPFETVVLNETTEQVTN